MTDGNVSVVAVDWGTSQLRIWPLDAEGAVTATRKSSQGMRSVKREQFEVVLEAHLGDLGIDPDVPVIMCGMVGSRQGWQEASYVPVPCRVAEPVSGTVQVEGITRDVRILPGLANRDPELADVMRSEETQLLGLFDILGDDLGGLVCMPGTHAKWVRFEKGVVLDFLTSLSGELFAALGAGSVLQHALAAATDKIDPESAHFTTAVRMSLREPATFLSRLFSVRPKNLLHEMSNNAAAAHVSGTIIGQDIAGALARFSPVHSVTLVESGHLGELYGSALGVAGLQSRTFDGDELAIRGLTLAARANWPVRFKRNDTNTGVGV